MTKCLHGNWVEVFFQLSCEKCHAASIDEAFYGIDFMFAGLNILSESETWVYSELKINLLWIISINIVHSGLCSVPIFHLTNISACLLFTAIFDFLITNWFKLIHSKKFYTNINKNKMERV